MSGFRIEMSTNTKAFGERPDEKVHEIMLILEDLVDWIHCSSVTIDDLKAGVPLIDTDGNEVGKAIYED